MITPLPNKSVRGSSSGVAVMALFDLLGRKWNMRIIWELKEKPLSFRLLQSQCDNMSPSVLNNRLKQLNQAELLLSTDEGYKLTDLGLSLMLALNPLREWSKNWQDHLSE